MALCRSMCLSVRMTAVLSLLTPALAGAQATGTVSGLVTDSTDAALASVALEVTNRATGLVRRSTTGADGVYVVPLLPPGDYDVKGTLAGFSTVVREGVRVSVSETARVNVTLSVGPLSAEVKVSGHAALVETGNATLGIVIDEKKIVDLPLNGRSFAQLGTLVPGVVAPPLFLGGAAGDATPGGLFNPTGSFNVNGMSNTSNNFLLDGATNNDTFSSGFILRPPPDAIQEFKILTHSYEAQYGRNAGSVVDVVTKSGTNTWHGAGWEFNRDDSLQARNFFADRNRPKPMLEQNQFGGALGMPVVDNRLFAFGYYEGYRRRAGTTTALIVPTAAQR